MSSAFAANYGGYHYESSEARALGSITPQSYDYRDQGKFMNKVAGDVSYMAAYMRKMQKGIDQANQNFIEQIQSLIQEVIIIFAGGGETGFDWGDLKYIIQAIGALFGLQPGLPLPISLFGAAWHFFSSYIIPVANFTEFLNEFIDTLIATVLDVFGEVPVVGQALEQLAVIIVTIRDQLLPVLQAVETFFDSFNIDSTDLDAINEFFAPLAPILAALTEAFGPYVEAGFDGIVAVLGVLFSWTGPFMEDLAVIINAFVNFLQNRSLYGESAAAISAWITRLVSLFDVIDFTAAIDVATSWITIFSNFLTAAGIPNLDASKIVTGVLSLLRIPGLPAAQVTSGTFIDTLIPALASSWGRTIDSSLLINAIASAIIPNFDASKIVTGVINALRIPDVTYAMSTGIQSIVNTIMSAFGFIGSGLSGLTSALQQIPFSSLLGYFGPLTAVQTLQTLMDNLIQALTSSTDTGGGLSDVYTAAAASTAIAQSANNIATQAAKNIANQAISNPAMWGLDPSASAPYPLSDLMGITPAPFINVTQANPAACYIDTPFGGIEKSIAWLGYGTITNIFDMRITLFSVNIATKVSTQIWKSANIISAVSGGAVPLWNFANIPAAYYIHAVQGQKYLAEISITSPAGTYKILGKTSSVNPHPNTPIGSIGATRTPPNLYSVTSSSGATAKNPSWPLTTVTNDNCILVDAVAYSNVSTITAMTATCGGVAMTQKKFQAFTTIATDAQSAVVVQFELHNAAFAAFTAGAKTIVITTTGGGTSGTQCAVQAQATSYQNISAVDAGTATTGNSASPAQTVTGLTADSPVILHSLLSNAIDNWTTGNQNIIANINGVTVTEPLLVQDQFAYATSVPFTGTPASGTGKWAASVVQLTSSLATPLSIPSAPLVFTDSLKQPWLALNGSEGISQIATVTKKFPTHGTSNWTIPANFRAAADAGAEVFIDIGMLPGAGPGDYAYMPGTGGSFAQGNGGSAGDWKFHHLQLGSGHDIPTTTTVISRTTGTGGVASDGVSSPTNGSNSSITATGWGTSTTTGGGAVGAAVDQIGESPGDQTYQSVNYKGGVAQENYGTDGNPPGGGGPGGFAYKGSPTFGQPDVFYPPGNGADGTVIFTIYMT